MTKTKTETGTDSEEDRKKRHVRDREKDSTHRDRHPRGEERALDPQPGGRGQQAIATLARMQCLHVHVNTHTLQARRYGTHTHAPTRTGLCAAKGVEESKRKRTTRALASRIRIRSRSKLAPIAVHHRCISHSRAFPARAPTHPCARTRPREKRGRARAKDGRSEEGTTCHPRRWGGGAPELALRIRRPRTRAPLPLRSSLRCTYTYFPFFSHSSSLHLCLSFTHSLPFSPSLSFSPLPLTPARNAPRPAGVSAAARGTAWGADALQTCAHA